MRGFSFVVILFAVVACAPSSSKTEAGEMVIDSLLARQVSMLGKAKASLSKSAVVSGNQSDTLLVPTSTDWKEELEVFRVLGTPEQKLYKGSYRVEGPLDDPRSNLDIRRYQNNNSPLRLLLIYYAGDLNRMKQITGIVDEVNPLYTAHRELTMHFDEVNGMPVLSTYKIEGYQKAAMRDTVWFGIEGKIIW